jgi:iron(III) transport system ATP-binding protein
VDSLSLAIGRGEIVCLLGASGCGKTTVLRAIAGFLAPSGGSIDLAGRRIADARAQLPPEQRQIGMVFQDFALFPHLTVAQNIAFGLQRGAGRMPPQAREQRVGEVLTMVQLQAHAKQYPHELSGGQQQRVALARALAPQPALLLLDEPFSSLDVELREQLSLELRGILKGLSMTALMVTHDQREAFALSDRVGIMNVGRIEQLDRAYQVYHRPATRFVADFVGEGVFLPAERQPANATAQTRLHTELGTIVAIDETRIPTDGQPLDVLLRPDDVVHDDDAPLQAQIIRKHFRGAEFLYVLRLPSGREIQALVPSHHDHAIGEAIGIRLDAQHVVAFARS